MNITKEYLTENNACSDGIKWFEAQNKTDAAELMIDAVKDGHADYANWLFSTLATKKQNVSIAVYAAELVIDIFESKYPNDERPRRSIEAAKEWLKNPCKETDDAACASAYASAYAAAYAAYESAYAAAYAADRNNMEHIQLKIVNFAIRTIEL